MYGTIARMRVKPGMWDKLVAVTAAEDRLNIPGHKDTKLYRMDADSNECYLVVVFDSKEAYDRNADSPEQDARYREFVQFLDGEPEWHDGEVVYSRT